MLPSPDSSDPGAVLPMRISILNHSTCAPLQRPPDPTESSSCFIVCGVHIGLQSEENGPIEWSGRVLLGARGGGID
eukprot:COSAG02_NODE_12665_length_1512_cov_1.797594_2_plen_75_part_01